MVMDGRSVSVRDFLVDEQDRIYRFPLSRFSAMVRDPERHSYPQLAGKRMRGAEVFVELDGSRPVGITRIVYFTLLFNENGILNKELHMRQQMARYNLHINAPLPAEDAGVVDAKDRFLSSTGQWKPTPDLEARLRDVALGKLRCHRL